LSQSPENTIELAVVENPRFAAGIMSLSVAVPKIKIFPVLTATLPFPVSFVIAIA